MQIRLLEMAMALKPGQARKISGNMVREAAAGELTGLDRMGGARKDDVADFVAKISDNWGVHMTEDIISGDWTMRKY